MLQDRYVALSFHTLLALSALINRSLTSLPAPLHDHHGIRRRGARVGL
jgi:hypothetical protein